MSGCVLWQGTVMNKGYGRMTLPGTGYGHRDWRDVLVHRAAWEKVHGPIPKRMILHHKCENKLCRNVEHLELLHRDEHAGGKGHGTLTRETAAQVKRMLAAGARGIDVAASFGISKQQVCNIKHGRCWA